MATQWVSNFPKCSFPLDVVGFCIAYISVLLPYLAGQKSRKKGIEWKMSFVLSSNQIVKLCIILRTCCNRLVIYLDAIILLQTHQDE